MRKRKKIVRYHVERIEEDIDFGCEERSADQPVMAVVILRAESGEEVLLKMEDQLLYNRGIEEGDMVSLDSENKLVKDR